MRAALAMTAGLPPRLFSPSAIAALETGFAVDATAAIESFDTPSVDLTGIDALITGWGAPWIGPAELDRLPNLRVIAHAAGSVRPHLDRAVWERGVLVSSAAEANALPVAEYTLAMILLAGKDVLWIARAYENAQNDAEALRTQPGIGGFGTTVGIIGASRIGTRVIELLRPFDFEVLVHDPYLPAAEAVALGARLVELDELLEQSAIVSLHAPEIPATRHMLDASRLALLRDGATLINTARAGLIEQDSLIDELRAGRIRAVLDVSDPEPLPAGHGLRSLANVFLTPHLAGAQGNELRRLGESALGELLRLEAGQPLAHPVTLDDMLRMA